MQSRHLDEIALGELLGVLLVTLVLANPLLGENGGRPMWEILLGLGSIAVGLAALAWQARLLERRLRVQTFLDFNQRYYGIARRFPMKIHADDFELPPGQRGDQFLREVRSYFFLCEEELVAHQQKWIDSAVWAGWEEGMRTALSRPGIQRAWEAMRADGGFSPATIRLLDPMADISPEQTAELLLELAERTARPERKGGGRVPTKKVFHGADTA